MSNAAENQGGTTDTDIDANIDTNLDKVGKYPLRTFPLSLIAVFQFFTILPLGTPKDYEAYPKRLYLIVLVGYLVGFIGAVTYLLLSIFFTPIFASMGAIAAIMIVYGFNHFDGVLDLGDGLMAHGSREKRIKALTDQTIGAGGTACGMLLILFTLAGILSIPALSLLCIPSVLILAEVAAKLSQVVFLTLGHPLREGMFSYVHSFSKRWFVIAALILCIPVILLPLPTIAFIAAAAGVIVVTSLLYFISKRLFGGINGDITGAVNELTRFVVIAAIAAVL